MMQKNAEAEKEMALTEKEEAQQKATRYGDAIIQLEEDFKQLQQLPFQSPVYQRKLNTINEKIKSTKPATREIDGNLYQKVE